MELLSSAQVEQFLEAKLADREIAGLIQQFALPYRELMAYYRCAMMEVSEKFHVLNEEMSLQYDRNPIETVKTRLKSPESIVEKLPSLSAISKLTNFVISCVKWCVTPQDS